jgi:hypothetical protein
LTSPGLASEPGHPGSDPRLSSIEELTIEPPGPDRSPAELSAIMRHSIGEIDMPAELRRQRDAEAPDTTALREELGL